MARAKVQKIRKAHLLLRDGDGCHICGLRMKFSAGTDHPLSVTYDHLQPASLGGSKHRKNLKLAHRYCNHYRGTAEIDDDLRTHCRGKIQDIFTNEGF